MGNCGYTWVGRRYVPVGAGVDVVGGLPPSAVVGYPEKGPKPAGWVRSLGAQCRRAWPGTRAPTLLQMFDRSEPGPTASRLADLRFVAETEGFEPPVALATLAFKASAFGRSATSPWGQIVADPAGRAVPCDFSRGGRCRIRLCEQSS